MVSLRPNVTALVTATALASLGSRGHLCRINEVKVKTTLIFCTMYLNYFLLILPIQLLLSRRGSHSNHGQFLSRHTLIQLLPSFPSWVTPTTVYFYAYAICSPTAALSINSSTLLAADVIRVPGPKMAEQHWVSFKR